MGFRDMFRSSPEELGDNETLLKARAENALAKLEQHKVDLATSTEGSESQWQHRVDQAQIEYDIARTDFLAYKSTKAHIRLGQKKMEFMSAKAEDKERLQSEVAQAQQEYDEAKAALDASFPKRMPESAESENH